MSLTKDDMRELLQPINDKLDNLQNQQNVFEKMLGRLDNRIKDVELTLENETNRNIRLLAENHGSLVDKLNDSIKVQSKSNVIEVEHSIFKHRLELLEKDMEEMKKKIS